jgi:hypothetical protein
MKSGSRRLHIETHDRHGSIELDIAGEKTIHKLSGSGDRRDLNAWLKHRVSTCAKSSGNEHSSASSQSICSTNAAPGKQMTGHASAQNQGGRREKLDMHERD